ncbi:PREDICTED: protein starmaker-like [Camelina sativa]|uniref:Protein starmaker-like n=1 Tax=Camelina sativa TaxID=90675 RepID=A0ABM0V7F1_CAMSA|nr:PREDICTED: protein starmaker-like [Camelina sativa]
MAEHREPNLDDNGSKSYFQKRVVLRDWWLIKCPKEFQGKRFGVAGIEDFVEKRAKRVLTSSPIIKALDVFTLLASDGIYITLRGFLNKERVVQNGFTPEISREFIFGFPPCWEQICNNCFGGGVSLGTDTNTVSSTVAKASYPILSPCNNKKENLEEDSPAEGRDESNVADTIAAEITTNTEDGSRPSYKITARRKSLHLQTRFGGESSEVHNTTTDGDHGGEGLDEAKSGNVENDTCEAIDKGVVSPADGSGRNHTGADNADKVTSTVTTAVSLTSEQQKGELRDGCEVFNNEDGERKLDESILQNLTTNDGDHGSEGLDKAKSGDVDKDEFEAINNGVILPADGCGRKRTDADNVDKVTSTSTNGEPLTSEELNGELKVTTASPHSLFKDFDKSSKPGRKGISKKSRKTLKKTGNVVEPSHCSETKVKSATKKRKPQNPTTNDKDRGKEGLKNVKSDDVERDECVGINDEVIDGCGRRHSGTDSVGKLTSKNATKESLTSEQRKGREKETKTTLLSKDLNSKPGKKGSSKKSEKTPKRDLQAAEENLSCESEENLSWGNTKRKIDFDVEVTPDNKVKKQKTSVVSTDSLGQKRSRSGRVFMSSLEYWRNQIPVYDMDRRLIEVKGGHETNPTPSKGKGSYRRKPRS